MIQDVTLQFYIAKHGNLLDKMIAWWTAPWRMKLNKDFLHIPSHVEIEVIEGVGFSASPREGIVRFKSIDFDSGRWVPVTIRAELDMYFVDAVLGSRYDTCGIFCHEFLPLDVQSDTRWWCSEVCAAVIGWPTKPNPYELWLYAKKKSAIMVKTMGDYR